MEDELEWEYGMDFWWRLRLNGSTVALIMPVLNGMDIVTPWGRREFDGPVEDAKRLAEVLFRLEE